MILFPGRHLMGVLECHHLTPPNKMVESKTHKLWCCQILYVLTLIGKWTHIYLLTLNKKWKIKIMGWGARLILLVVVSVCVVCCVLCCLENNLVFSSVTISHILKNENYELCFLAGFFVDQIMTGKNYDRKKRYSRLAVGCNKSQITSVVSKYEHQLSPEKNTTRKKVQSSGRWLE